MRRFFKSICLPLIVLTLVACGHRIQPPNRGINPPPAPQLIASDIGASVTIDLKKAGELVKGKLPDHLDSGTERINVPANITLMLPTEVAVTVVDNVTKQIHKLVPSSVSSTCQKGGILGFIFFPCQVIKQVDLVEDVVVPVARTVIQKVEKATNVKSPLDVDVSRDLHLQAINLSMQGNRLQVDGDVDFSLDVKADAKIIKVGVSSCGVGESRPVVRLSEAILISWRPDGQLGLDTQPWSLSWPAPCKLTFADLPLETVLKIPALQAKISATIDNQIAKIPASIDFTQGVATFWKELEQPQEIVKDVWLVANPESASISNPVGENGAVHFDVAFSCEPYIVYGNRPAPALNSQPVLAHLHSGSGFNIDLEGRVRYADALKKLNNELSGKEISYQGHTMRITDIDLYASGNTLAIGVGISKPFKSRLWLFGKPLIDIASNKVRVDNIDYSLETKNVIAKVAEWILHSSLQQELQNKAEFPLSNQVQEARKELAKFEDKNVGPVVLRIKTTDVLPESVFLTKDDIRARIRVKGTAEIALR